MIHTEDVEVPEDFERKRHYQMLKVECAKLAFAAMPGEGEDDTLALAKKLYRSFTEERWGSEPVEGASE